MPLIPEEPQIYESVPGPRNAAGTARTSQGARPAASIPGPRPSSRSAPPRSDSRGPAPERTHAAGSPPTPHGGASSAAPTANIQLVAATDETAVEMADEAVDKLLDEGSAPGDVLLLTTGEQHPWAQHELSFGEDAYWRQLTDSEDVFCADAAELSRIPRREVVVLAVNGGTDTQAAQALPAALAKATAQLIVCGDPQRLRGLV